MKIGAIMIIGVFFNMMMISVFPTLFLGDSPSILGGDTLGYTFEDSGIVGDDYKQGISNYQTITGSDQLNDLTSTEGGIVSGILEGVSSFFDGLLDGLDKLKTYTSFIIPFSTLFFALPGALGLVMGTLYSVMTAMAIIRFIRGA